MNFLMCKDNKNLGKTRILCVLCDKRREMKRIIAVLAGCIVSVLVIFLSEGLSHTLNPPPEDIDLNDPEQLKTLMAEAPFLALLMVQIGAFLGAFAGGMVASAVYGQKDKLPALGVGVVLTLLGLINLILIPHPVWFTITALVVYVTGSYTGYTIYHHLKKKDA